MMNRVNNQYRKNLENMIKKDGLKALVVYCLVMAGAFFRGGFYTTDASVFLLNSSQIWIPMTMAILFLCFLFTTKKK